MSLDRSKINEFTKIFIVCGFLFIITRTATFLYLSEPFASICSFLWKISLIICIIVSIPAVIMRNRKEGEGDNYGTNPATVAEKPSGNRTEKIIALSKRYKAMVELNKQYNFVPIIEANQHSKFYANLNTKSQFDRFDCYAYIRSQMGLQYEQFGTLLKEVHRNRKLYNEYLYALNGLPPLLTEDDYRLHGIMFPSLATNKEEQLVKKLELNPVRDITMTIYVTYTSPAGRNYYDKEYNIGFAELNTQYELCMDKVVYQQTKAYQRSVLTVSMRYDVIKRDGGRCVICGRSASDGVKLHVDHIIPVSKGGKTEMSNLRTLCDSCNRGKSAKYDPYGFN